MASEGKGELQHLPARSSLAVGRVRSGLVARGRREAADAASNADYAEAVRRYREGDVAGAAEKFGLAAEQGHAESQYMLSTLYDAGEGVAQDAHQAAYWERRAAEQGHAYAQANLSYRHYEAGELEEAFAWCMRAAHSKLAWAQYNVGLMYRKGEGVPRSDAEAANWYRLAAEQDFAEAQQKLADLYYFGQGLRQDYSQAAVWYRKAAVNGNAEAQFQLGHLYATGQGVEPDYVQSRHWTRQAALQGHEQAIREQKRREYRDP
jgi:uncharacterized protein